MPQRLALVSNTPIIESYLYDQGVISFLIPSTLFLQVLPHQALQHLERLPAQELPLHSLLASQELQPDFLLDLLPQLSQQQQEQHLQEVSVSAGRRVPLLEALVLEVPLVHLHLLLVLVSALVEPLALLLLPAHHRSH